MNVLDNVVEFLQNQQNGEVPMLIVCLIPAAIGIFPFLWAVTQAFRMKGQGHSITTSVNTAFVTVAFLFSILLFGASWFGIVVVVS